MFATNEKFCISLSLENINNFVKILKPIVKRFAHAPFKPYKSLTNRTPDYT